MHHSYFFILFSEQFVYLFVSMFCLVLVDFITVCNLVLFLVYFFYLHYLYFCALFISIFKGMYAFVVIFLVHNHYGSGSIRMIEAICRAKGLVVLVKEMGFGERMLPDPQWLFSRKITPIHIYIYIKSITLQT